MFPVLWRPRPHETSKTSFSGLRPNTCSAHPIYILGHLQHTIPGQLLKKATRWRNEVGTKGHPFCGQGLRYQPNAKETQYQLASVPVPQTRHFAENHSFRSHASSFGSSCLYLFLTKARELAGVLELPLRRVLRRNSEGRSSGSQGF